MGCGTSIKDQNQDDNHIGKERNNSRQLAFGSNDKQPIFWSLDLKNSKKN